MASGSITFIANRWGKSGKSDKFYFLGLWTLQMVTAAMKLEDTCSLERKLWQTFRAYYKAEASVHIVKAMVFPVVYVWMWELDHQGGWAQKNWCFRIVVLEKTLKSPLDSKAIKPVYPKGNETNIHWKGSCWFWSSSTFFGHQMWGANSLEKTLILGKIEGKTRSGWQRVKWLDSITDSVTWTWANSRR